MSSPDQRYHVIYNGEIYNFKELRAELIGYGHRFRSSSDTEVLLAAYAQWGVGALERFVGMFAFALFDAKRRTILLARDFFGIKPLYYAAQEGFLCFGSEIKALLSLGVPEMRADAERLFLYLRYGISDFGGKTLLSTVQQVPPAHYLEIPLDGKWKIQPQRYWSPESAKNLDISFEQAAAQLRDLFMRSVELHLRSDVPVGSALSGGIDSSAIVMAMREIDAQADIHTFSFVTSHERFNEERWVDLVAREARAHVHKIHVGAGDIAADLDAILHFHDEPLGSSSTYAQYRVFRAARSAGIKVMLDGQGADEILAGYGTYLGARLASLLRQQRWSQAATLIQGFSQLDEFGVLQGLSHCADYLLPPFLQHLARKLQRKEVVPDWLNARWFEQQGVAPHQRTNYTRSTEVLRHSLNRSLIETLPSLLRYEDRNSMASSVESRVPFLTPQLVSFLGSLPEHYLVSAAGTTKSVFRQAMRGIVPDVVLDRKDKLGFVTPEHRWLSRLDDWIKKTLNSDAAHQVPCLNIKVALREWELVRAGRRAFNFRIWRWVNVVRWTEMLNVSYR